MNNISILDCTLRDGGYVNSWDFGRDTIKKIIEKLTAANIDIIECGFISDIIYDENITLFRNTDDINSVYDISNKNPMYVGMIALGEKEIHYDKIAECTENTLSGIRITFHKDEVGKAIEYAENLMYKGYKIFMQPVGTMFYKDIELLQLIERINELQPFAFYIVDTLGSMSKNELLRLFYLIDNNLNADINIGFHSHNNLQLAFSNAIALVELTSNRNIIIDSSVFGMGRGAGNLCTELITGYLNSQANLKYGYVCVSLFSIIDSCLTPIKKENEWGYSAPYYIAATKNCHPSYASYLISKQTLTSLDIDKILSLIPRETSYLYDTLLIDELYRDYQENAIDDTESIEQLKQFFENKEIVLIAPGKSIMHNKEKIQKLISNDNVVSMSVNFSDIFETDFIFVSNKKRHNNMDVNKHRKFIVTSNIDSNIIGKIDINYAKLLNSNEITYENSGLMAIKLLTMFNFKKIHLAGFDGFSINASENYYDKMRKTADDIKLLQKMNSEIQNSLMSYFENYNIDMITDSIYTK